MKGIVPSLNTPFDIDGALDHASLRHLVSHTVNAGCGGMLGLAVAGEHVALSLAEKTAFIETVTDANSGRIPFIVSATAPDPSVSVELAKPLPISKRQACAYNCTTIWIAMESWNFCKNWRTTPQDC